MENQARAEGRGWNPGWQPHHGRPGAFSSPGSLSHPRWACRGSFLPLASRPQRLPQPFLCPCSYKTPWGLGAACWRSVPQPPAGSGCIRSGLSPLTALVVRRARASGRYFLRCVIRVLSVEVTEIWRLKGEPKSRLRTSGHWAKE